MSSSLTKGDGFELYSYFITKNMNFYIFGVSILVCCFISCEFNRKEVQERYEVSRDFKDCDLSGLNLTEMSLKFANFEGANLEGVDFTDAKLDFANFRNANLKNAKFMGAVTFQGADFRGADLRQAEFGAAILLNSILHDSATKVQGSSGLFRTQRELDDWIHHLEAEFFDEN